MRENVSSRLSYSHEKPEFRQLNPLYAKANSITMSFEIERDPNRALQLRDMNKTEAERRRENAERIKRRNSFMVKRQKPKPVLRPSPALAYGPDRAAFNSEWKQEQRQAQYQNKIRKLKAVKTELLTERENLNQADNERRNIPHTPNGLKKLFKLERTVDRINQRVHSHTHKIKRNIRR